MDKTTLLIIGLGISVLLIYTGITILYKNIISREGNDLKKVVENSWSVEICSKNDSCNIITFLIDEGGNFNMNEIEWRMQGKNDSHAFYMAAIKKNRREFTDYTLHMDKYHEIYWYDSIKDGVIGKGDFIKVKAPSDGEYYLMAFWKNFPVLITEDFHY